MFCTDPDNRGGRGIGNAIRMNGECVSRSRDHEMFAIFFVKDGYTGLVRSALSAVFSYGDYLDEVKRSKKAKDEVAFNFLKY